MKKPFTDPKSQKQPVQEAQEINKRDLVREQHSNHFTNRAPGSKQ